MHVRIQRFLWRESTYTYHRGGTALYKPYRYVPFSLHSSLKTGIDFAHFDLELGMVFEETTGVYKRICCFTEECQRNSNK